MTVRPITRHELDQPLMPYEDALALVTAAASPLPASTTPLTEALGLVAGEDVVSALAVPPFASSAMDGYAVRAADVRSAGREHPVVLPVVGSAPAGSSRGTLTDGTAVTIMTGGPIPAGSDAIVPWELTDRRGDAVAVLQSVPAGEFVRPAGEDIAAGSVVVRAGDVLTPVRLGVLASVGRENVVVHPRPRVAVLSTGDELAAPGASLRPGEVFDTNRTLLASMARAVGGNVVAEETVADDPDAVLAWLSAQALDAELVVTSGGVSVGERDWVRPVLQGAGELLLWRVAIKPGKPVALGRLGQTLVLAVPGNPGSAFACMHAFGYRLLRRMLGRDPEHSTFATVPLATDVRGSRERTTLSRVQLRDGKVWPLPARSSVVLSNLIPADGFAIVPPGGLTAGDAVRFEGFGQM